MAEPDQSYKTHARYLPAFHFFVVPVLAINVVNEMVRLWRLPTLGTAFQVVVAAALLTLAFLSRTQPLTAQDRVIRLEMRLRLRDALPPDLQARINDLSPRQLVALRFASDAELPGLVRDVLDGRLTDGKEIKKRVRNWQADWLRV
jgi:uncharacterized protein DUF6526